MRKINDIKNDIKNTRKDMNDLYITWKNKKDNLKKLENELSDVRNHLYNLNVGDIIEIDEPFKIGRHRFDTRVGNVKIEIEKITKKQIMLSFEYFIIQNYPILEKHKFNKKTFYNLLSRLDNYKRVETLESLGI